MYSLRTPEYGILGSLPPPPHPPARKYAKSVHFLLRQEYTKNRKNTYENTAQNTAFIEYRLGGNGQNTAGNTTGIHQNTTKNTSENTAQNTTFIEYRLVVQNTTKNTSENTAQNT